MSRKSLPVILLLAAVGLPAFAQQGDRAGHNMEDPPADLPIPPAPHLSVEEALKAMQVEKGFEVGCALSEPKVVDPVQAVFDEDGRLWVAEMRGYMPDVDATDENAPVGVVSVHEDKDGDGRFETSSVFMDKLVLPRAIAIVPGGVLISEHSALLFVPRVGGRASGQAQVVDPAYGNAGNVEHRASALAYGLDNRWHSTYSNRAYQQAGGAWSWVPDEKRGQFGMDFDDWGRPLSNNNSLPAVWEQMPAGLLAGNPCAPQGTPQVRSDNRVHPIRITPGVNRAYIREGQEGSVMDKDWKLKSATATCGPAFYHGDLPAFGDGLFVPEPAGNLVMRYDAGAQGDKWKITNPGRAFLASTDERFRPVNMVTGPDGFLYVVDMDRGILQHKTYVTSYLRRQIKARNLEYEGPAGWGRIWRIAPEGAKAPARRPQMSRQTSAELVPYLADASGWWRLTAQRVLVGRKDAAVVPLLEKMATTHDSAFARLHALWTLQGMGALRLEVLAANAGAKDAGLRQSVARLFAERPAAEGPRVAPLLAGMAKDGGDRFVLATVAFAEGVRAARGGTPPQPEIMALAKDKVVAQYLVSGLAGAEGLVPQGAPGVPAELAKMSQAAAAARAKLKNPPAPWTPVAITLKPWTGEVKTDWKPGEQAYSEICGACHGGQGEGTANIAPPLAGSAWVQGSSRQLITAVLNGITGPIVVNGEKYEFNDSMPGFLDNQAMDDAALAGVLTYIRSNWGHDAAPIKAGDVQRVRAELGKSPRPMTAEQILKVEPWPTDVGFVVKNVKPGQPGRGFFATEAGRTSVLLFVLLTLLLGPPILGIMWSKPQH